MTILHQDLPSAWEAREALREKGQFWTPAWVAEAMVAYALAGGSDLLFDPAVGEGAFLRAGRDVSRALGRRVALAGGEVDPLALEKARDSGLGPEELAGVQLRDFIADPPEGPFPAIVGNPPYLRHHRLDASLKAHLRQMASRIVGRTLDGRAGLHVYFLLQALQLLEEGGRLAFILPADVCEGVFAPVLWRWIAGAFRLDAVVMFEPDASPFPRVDTNALVFLIRKAPPQEYFLWARAREAWTDDLKQWALSDLTAAPGPSLSVVQRRLAEGLSTGLSRPYVEQTPGPTLGDYARIMRGIATGANEFFFLTPAQASRLQLPEEFLISAVGRTRDVEAEEITTELVEALRAGGRPTLLLSLDGRPPEAFPAPVRAYLRQGEAAGLPARSLIRQRKPWYKMEVRQPPAFLFAYLGRRNARFIRNTAGITPLTGFLCVYPHLHDTASTERLWAVLRHPDTVANLARVGKSYGSGAIKVEPRALERLPLPEHVLREAGLPPLRLLLERRASYRVGHQESLPL